MIPSEWRCDRCEARFPTEEMERICDECNDGLLAVNASNVLGEEEN